MSHRPVFQHVLAVALLAGSWLALDVQAAALPFPPLASEWFTPASIAIGEASTLSFAFENPNDSAITGLAFTDNYPGGMVNAPGDLVVSNTCGGTITADPDGNSLVLGGGVIAAQDMCLIQIRVIGTASGALPNMTTDISSDNAPPGGGPVATLTVAPGPQLAAPLVAEVFAPAAVKPGQISYLAVTLSNGDPARSIVGAHFANALAAGMSLPPWGVVVSNTCGGDVMPSGSALTLNNGIIPADGSCTVVARVIGNATGTSSTGPVTSANAQTATGASAQLTVAPDALLDAPIVSKSFAPDHVVVGDLAATTIMAITLTNDDPYEVDNVGFTDNYPSPLHMANAPSSVVFANTCFGQLTADANATFISLQGGRIAPNDSCVIKIQVVGTSVGTSVNHTGPVTSDNALPGVDATATLTVEPQPIGDTPQTIVFTSASPANAIVAGTSYAATATATSGLPVTLSIDDTSATVCEIENGMVSFIGAGTCTIDANQPGDQTYAPASETQQSFPVSPADGSTAQTITFSTAAPVDATVVGPAYFPAASATSSLPVILTVDGASATVCAIDQGVVTFIGGGICTIDANQGGDATYAPAPEVQQSFSVGQSGGIGAQWITFTSTAPDDATVVGPSYFAAATATSNLPVVLTIDGSSATVCTIDNDIVWFIGAGNCTIDANQGGDASWAPASQKQQSFPVASAGGVAPQAITFASTAPLDARVAGSSYLAIATATSNLPVVLTIDGASATVCTINHGTVMFIGAGTCTIDANQGGDTTYAAASQVQQSFPVAPATGATPQTVTFTSTVPASATVGGDSYLATAEATSGLPVVLTIDVAASTVCAINNGTVSFIGAGVCTIDANQGGDAIFAPASEVQQSFAVDAASGVTPQTITFTSTAPTDATLGGPVYVATAVASSGLPVALSIDDASSAVCSINNGTVSFIGPGACIIDADQGGDATYAPAPEVQQSFDVTGGAGAPTVVCVLPPLVESVGDTISIDLSLLFTPPPGQSLSFYGTYLPPSLSIVGTLLTGTFQPGDVPAPPYAYASTLHAVAVPAGTSASEHVTFTVLPAGERLFNDTFGGDQGPCQ